MSRESPMVLLVDDSESDTLLMRTMLERAGAGQALRSVPSGEAARAYLSGETPFHDRGPNPIPVAVLLDLNMPHQDGFEILTWIRAQAELRNVRVFILSASSLPTDIQRAYALGADSYLIKPRNLDGLAQLVRTLVTRLRLARDTPLRPPAATR